MNYYEEDENKLIEAYRIKGHTITREQASDIWEEYSEVSYARWLQMTDKLDDLYEITKEYAEALKVI